MLLSTWIYRDKWLLSIQNNESNNDLIYIVYNRVHIHTNNLQPLWFLWISVIDVIWNFFFSFAKHHTEEYIYMHVGYLIHP